MSPIASQLNISRFSLAHPSLPERRVLELFAGIGGLACCWSSAHVVAAIDINQNAAHVYRRNFSHPYAIREIQSLTDRELADYQADFWWLSPPCQPFSRRGHRQDEVDPRTRGLLRMIQAIDALRPRALGLENVVGFAKSQTCELLRKCLDNAGYCVLMDDLCPSQMAWPNRRPRTYLLASLDPLLDWQPLPQYAASLVDFLEPDISPDSDLWLADELKTQYSQAIDRVDPSDDNSIAACFAGSYGKTLLRAGSYLRCGDHYRRFAPREVARLMGFPNSFDLAGVSQRTAWKLLGNSLSLPVVRYVLSHLDNESK